MANTGSLKVDITPKVVKVTAEVELHVDGKCIGTTTVDLTPDESTTDDASSEPARTFVDDVGRRWEWCGGADGTWAWRITKLNFTVADLAKHVPVTKEAIG